MKTTNPVHGTIPEFRGIELFRLGLLAEDEWTDGELGAALEEFLLDPWIPAIPIQCQPAASATHRAQAAGGEPQSLSLVDQLALREPSLILLRQVKDFAKSNWWACRPVVPRPVAAVVYHTCVGIAAARLGRSISKLPAADLRNGLEWALNQSWVSRPVHDWLAEALGALLDAQ